MPEANLTFAEAMALDPSDVECEVTPGRWVSDWTDYTMAFLRLSHFRRARPRRSRVQEMAEQAEGAPVRAEHYELAIRAVCEYLRTNGYERPHHAGAFATDIECEFLEER